MKTLLRILIIEDSEDDTLLLVNQIKKSVTDLEFRRVQTGDAMRSALIQQEWDIILSDYHMPKFDGLEALAILKEMNIDIPFIIISGVIGEEQAVQVMKLGAQDYLLKNNLAHLFPAIERELREAETRAENKLLRKKQEEAEAIRLSEEKFKNLISNMHVGVLLQIPNGNIQLVNKEALDLLHLSTDQLNGNKPIPDNWNAKYEDGSAFPGFNHLFKQMSVLPQPIRNLMIEVNRASKNNSAWIMLDALPQINYDGVLQQIVWTFVDRTERKKAIEALRISEEKYRLLVEMSPEGIAIQQENNIVYINTAGVKQIGAKTKEEIIGKSIFEVVHPDFKEKLKNNLSSVRNVVSEPFTEEKFIRMDGSSIDVELTAIPSTFLGKDATQVIIRDITERKKAEEELKSKTQQLAKLNQEKDKFFSIIAHDLRGPISSLIGITGLLAENILSIPQSKLPHIFEELRDSASNLYQLLENLLQWAKIQQGLSPFNPETINLLKNIKQSLAVNTDLAKNKNIEIVITIPENLAVFADKNMFQFIIRNLVSNAIKFTNKGGMVSILAKKIGKSELEIEIKDTGIGMNKEILDKLFKLNAPINRLGTEGEPSSGLGLILCKEYIQRNGGQIKVISQVELGTSFFILMKDR